MFMLLAELVFKYNIKYIFKVRKFSTSYVDNYFVAVPKKNDSMK